MLLQFTLTEHLEYLSKERLPSPVRLILQSNLIHAEFVEWANKYNGPKFHAVLSDPPYGLKFMGKDWDRVSAKEWGDAMMPLLYPGAIVFMFGGTRTWHRLATGMEEAGFEIWDTLMWLYGTGFPKAQAIDKFIDDKRGLKRKVLGKSPNWRESKRNREKTMNSMEVRGENAGLITECADDVSLPWSGRKTCALKPAWEPILCFRAPRQGKNYADLAMEYGSGALNMDGGRIGVLDGDRTKYGRDRELPHANTTVSLGKFSKVTPYSRPNAGRYPANLVLDEESAEMLDEQAGDKGGPSRFFYCAKASRSERENGLEGFDGEQRDLSRRPDQKAMNDGEGNPYNRGVVKVRNNHPTVKPIVLTKWLATLLLPPDSVKPRRLLVPFAGSGSEMIGALQAGWDEVIGIEQSEEYINIGKARLSNQVSHGQQCTQPLDF